jgi:L-seryl-tRNA(Ser) seleniumtransferase
LRMLRRNLADIADQANRIAAAIGEGASGVEVTTTDGFSQMGSGSLPTQNLLTRLVAIRPKSIEAGDLAGRLRGGEPPVFARVHKGDVLFDPRTLLDGDEGRLVNAVVEALRPA